MILVINNLLDLKYKIYFKLKLSPISLIRNKRQPTKTQIKCNILLISIKYTIVVQDINRKKLSPSIILP